MKLFSTRSRETGGGFTLIELLVVISIIGLLSSVVLASLGNTRDKAKSTKIRTGVLELRKAIELGRSSDGSYGNLPTSVSNTCGAATALTDTNLTGILNDILSVYGKIAYVSSGPGGVVGGFGMVIYTDAYNSGSCSVAISNTTTNVPGGVPTRYAIFAGLGPTIGSNGYVCVDSTGNSIASTTATFTGFKNTTPTNFMTGGYCQ
jgi:prepilin-type N-terminal cleavage/methylation domain-containing protein